MRNLVGNAIKFTPVGGGVTVTVEGDGPFTVRIVDTGVGMAPGLIADLFRLDVRTTSTGTAGERGSGLGLLLCRDLAERLGTTLEVESSVGAGTTFSFQLPLAG